MAERPAHGFAIARALTPEGEVGRIWSCTRPLVYRALAVLVELGLIEEHGTEQSDRGPRRTLLTTTRAGRREVDRWLSEPVAHVRELRSGLMLKLLFVSRRGRSAEGLLTAQRAMLVPVVEGLEIAQRASDGFERALYLWRLESARAALRFTDGLLGESSEAINRAESAVSPSP